ncbi:MAG TPA: ribonuclease catalytic domain-containing protein [Burkholderiales bacterium]|nr:ribonuclease catalytic domain-containing protein [Burkholderiales bacterium]
MNVFYEEGATFKVGQVIADQTTSLHVEAPHGKRSKIKASSVLVSFDRPSPLEFLVQAQKVADQLDPDFLWECSGENEFDYHSLAHEYFGRKPEPPEAAGLVLRLHSAPMHFYKRGMGRYKPAPAPALAAAKASVERKKREAEQQTKYVARLAARELPEEFAPVVDRLLYDPDKNTLAWKALEAACRETRLSAPKLLLECGALPSVHDYHFNRFVFEHFPQGIEFPELPAPDSPEGLALSEAQAFSIDDATTTEIDDAFSVARSTNGNWRIGVHIAAPALGFAPESEIDRAAVRRLSTIYTPARKITMLPDAVIERFSLQAGHSMPALSMYLEVSCDDFTVVARESRVERVEIAANLRHDVLEQVFNEASIATGALDHFFGPELLVLWRLATRLEAERGKPQLERRVDYNFYVSGDRVRISERRRGSPIDKVVSELMIQVNSAWANELARSGMAAVYRSQSEGKVRMSLEPLPHQALGVPRYVWASSPLRRYVDLVNQRQIAAVVRGETPPYRADSQGLYSAMRDFELAYEAYAEFQRTMERYWSLVWLLQEGIATIGATVIKENLVKIDRVPLITRMPSLPPVAVGSRVEVAVTEVDLVQLGFSCAYKRRLEELETTIEENQP